MKNARSGHKEDSYEVLQVEISAFSCQMQFSNLPTNNTTRFLFNQSSLAGQLSSTLCSDDHESRSPLHKTCLFLTCLFSKPFFSSLITCKVWIFHVNSHLGTSIFIQLIIVMTFLMFFSFLPFGVLCLSENE